MSERVSYPGYRYAYTSTSQWARAPEGPYVCITYTPPDADGMSLRTESFHWTLEDARATAESSAAPHGSELATDAPGSGLEEPSPGATPSERSDG